MSGELSSSTVTGPAGTAAILFLEDGEAWVTGFLVPESGAVVSRSSAWTTQTRRFGSVGAAALVQGH